MKTSPELTVELNSSREQIVLLSVVKKERASPPGNPCYGWRISREDCYRHKKANELNIEIVHS